MTHWIDHPLTLAGETVTLTPLMEAHLPELEKLAKDKRIWEFYLFDGTNSERFLEVMRSVIADRDRGSQYAFVITHNATNTIIGSTRMMGLQPAHRRLEIGGTWLNPAHWATEVNFECKLLLLTHAFETLKTSSIYLKTDENNERSRKAIQKIGGKYEGTFRHEMIRDNGTTRNSAYYSIIDAEWPSVKTMLTGLYEDKKKSKK